MRQLIVLLLAIFLCCTASADRLGNTYIKVPLPPTPGTPDGRDGGETVDDAFVIPALPFGDTGSTTDNIDDYDEACPYTGSLSPDVVYSFTPSENIVVDIDLCESDYDTKVYVYENTVTPGAPYACNDDAECDLPYRSAILGLDVTAGNTYYIVIDGYGSVDGDYTLNIDDALIPPPCDLVCPDGGHAENEPALVDDYVDNYNGGCNSDPFVFMHPDYYEYPICGVSGWYTSGGANSRDTDWYSLVSGVAGYVTTGCQAEYDVYMYILLPVDCNNAGVVYEVVCHCEELSQIEFPHPVGNEVWVFIAPTEFFGPVNEFEYIFIAVGLYPGSPVNTTSWGRLKNEFK
jgi:hypothetical protein